MTFFRFNNPLHLPWSHDLLDVSLLTCFVIAVVYSGRAYRRGRPEYAVLMVTALFYGQIIELSGMIWHHSYTQGEFAIMLDYRVFPLFARSTAMPAYVIILYPTLLFLGYRLVEPIGVIRRWQRAVTGGLIMALLDAPYAIQGGLAYIDWWTWRPWYMYQFWMTWPLADLWWRLTWDALLLWVIYRSTPRIRSWYADPAAIRARTHWKALVVVPLGIAVAVNLVGPLLHLPIVIPTVLGLRQAPFVTLLVLAEVTVVVFAEKRPRREIEVAGLVAAGVYVLSMAVLVTGDIVHVRAVTDYVTVQFVALTALAIAAVYPPVVARRNERHPLDAGTEMPAHRWETSR